MKTLAAPHEYRLEVKKSVFLARAWPVAGEEEVKRRLVEDRIGDATHNCWAWRLGAVYRSSDDGEPGGTAGRPILSAIDGQELDGILVMVTRWFGGIKLGAGGLVRAYRGSAAACLREARVVEVHPTVRLRVALPFDCSHAIYDLADQHPRWERLGERWTAVGVEVDLEIPEAHREQAERSLADASRGQAQVERIPPETPESS